MYFEFYLFSMYINSNQQLHIPIKLTNTYIPTHTTKPAV